MSEVKLNHLTTERRNEKTMNLDTLSTHELLEIMNEEDHKVPEAVREAIPEIEKAVQAIIKALRSGGRLIYMGAGTSGRLGVIDSAECMPTFGTTYEVVGAKKIRFLNSQPPITIGSKQACFIGLASNPEPPELKAGSADFSDPLKGFRAPAAPIAGWPP